MTAEADEQLEQVAKMFLLGWYGALPFEADTYGRELCDLLIRLCRACAQARCRAQ